MARPTDPTPSTAKILFALSCNICSVPGCEEKLADPGWAEVNADIAHIHGANPGSARFEASMTDDQRRAFENLLLVCPNHHRRIDRLEPHKFPPDLLRDWKARHDERCADAKWWTTDEELDRASLLLFTAVADLGEDDPGTAPIAIVSADWGTDAQNVDVSPTVRGFIDSEGRLATTASKDVFDDPVQGEVKRLVVVYRASDGRERARRFVETEPVRLP